MSKIIIETNGVPVDKAMRCIEEVVYLYGMEKDDGTARLVECNGEGYWVVVKQNAQSVRFDVSLND